MNLKNLFQKAFMAAICWGAFAHTDAKITLPSFFTSNMVLQQQSTVKFHGTASPMKAVNIDTSWNGETVETQADAAGNWSVDIQTPAAGGPYKITLSDGKKLTLENVLVGEVWFCSGQ